MTKHISETLVERKKKLTDVEIRKTYIDQLFGEIGVRFELVLAPCIAALT